MSDESPASNPGGALLPCPLCGGKAHAYQECGDDRDYWRVSCLECDLYFVSYITGEEGRLGAIAAWNRRPKREEFRLSEAQRAEMLTAVAVGDFEADVVRIVERIVNEDRRNRTL